MHIKSGSPESYIAQLSPDRKPVMEKLRKVILENLPEGFEEGINYGMIGYSVPHSIYPKGYHTDPNQPLPFINIASQRNHIALYHMGIYTMPELMKWFTTEFTKHSKSKLDMGKSCIRFKKSEDIPYDLIAELVRKVSATEWIREYESNLIR